LASIEAQKLAGYLTLVDDFNYRVMQFVQRAILPGSGPEVIAEVMYSGLITRLGETDKYCFIEDFKTASDYLELQARFVSNSKSNELLEDLSDFIDLYGGQGRSFSLWIDQSTGTNKSGTGPHSPVARINREALKNLGITYPSALAIITNPTPPNRSEVPSLTVALQLSILIVDDDFEWLNKLRKAIQEDFPIVLASSFEDARACIEGNTDSFSVAVIDTCLDNKNPKNDDGIRLADRIQEISPRTKIIFTTEKFSVEQYKRIHKKHQNAEVIEKRPSDNEFSESEFVRIVKEASQKAELADVFVMMPLKDEYKQFYKNIIQPFFEPKYPICRRADEFFGPGIVMPNIFEYIKSASFCLGDISGRNENVIFEVGMTHALERSVILITRDKKDVPNVLEPIRWFLFQEDRPQELCEKLEKAVEELERSNYQALFERGSSVANIDPDHCIILATHDSQHKNAVSQMIKPVLKGKRIQMIDLLNEVHSSHKIQEYWRLINQANVVIADLTDRNLDVFYLAGFAYALEKQLVFISDDASKIPFDLKDCSLILYPEDSAKEKFNNVIDGLIKEGKMRSSKNSFPVKSAFSPAENSSFVPPVDVLLVTATEIECRTVIAEAYKLTGYRPSLFLSGFLNSKNAYHDLSFIGKSRVMMVETGKGVLNASQVVAESISQLNPKSVIMVGIAFGTKPAKQRLGDVLVAEQIVYYDLQRIGTSPNGTTTYQVRGDRASCSRRLWNLVRAVYVKQKKIKAHFGLVLSGDNLVDNLEYRNHLCFLEPGAIGGEMEGAGMYFAAKENKVDWILVKGICDWVDGNKNRDEEAVNQRRAVRNAVRLVLEALQMHGS
jgi:nucleoside phosphorylase/DNA-binding NarL/FixJ family response regulator